MIAIIGWVGFVSGGVFALLMSFAENGKAIRNISLAQGCGGFWVLRCFQS
jgi:hypothetical protein